MVRVIGTDDGGYRLEQVDGALLGTVRNRVVRLGRFSSDEDAISAAQALWTALDAALQRHYASWPRYAPDPAALRLVHDGAYEWVSDGVRPLARVIRSPSRPALGHARLEFVLPTFATEGVAIGVATALVKALEQHTNTRERSRHPIVTHAMRHASATKLADGLRPA